MLSSSYYKGVPIIIDQEINLKVQEAILAKIREEHPITKLERIIMDVGIFIEGRYGIDGMVNSESDFNENLVKNVKFRLVGVPPDVAGELVDIDFSQDIESAIKDVQKAYGLNPILNHKF
ncbi:MAG: hypothetical protein ACXACC_04230, partial [Promethearchaeota archaeon]